MAEFVGVLLGDGSINVYPGVRHTYRRVQITGNSEDDLEYGHYLCGLVERLFGVSPYFTLRRFERAFDVRLFKSEIVNYLTQTLGMKSSPKMGRAVIPGAVLDAGNAKHVLRGYFDTDGSVVLTRNGRRENYPRLEMKVCASPMRRQLIGIVRDLGFRYLLSPDSETARQVRVQINGYEQLRRWCDIVGFSNPKHARKAALALRENEVAGEGISRKVP
jgi:intein/homing endonuclease